MTITSTDTENNTVDNGVNVDALLGAREMLSGAPEAAQFTFSATNVWASGTHSRSTVNKFFGLGDDQAHRQPYSVDTDHPGIFASEDNGPTPAEMILMGLAGCLTAGVASVAQNRGIQLHSVTSTVEGDLDVAGILGIDPDVRNGFNGIRVRFEIDADATSDEIRAVVAQSQKRSAVFDAVANPTAIVVDVT
jgi:uncharacterized OsmC-like protein